MRTSAIIKRAFLDQAKRGVGLAGKCRSPALMYPNPAKNANVRRLFPQVVSQYL
jgi:hypothetical protein